MEQNFSYFQRENLDFWLWLVLWLPILGKWKVFLCWWWCGSCCSCRK